MAIPKYPVLPYCVIHEFIIIIKNRGGDLAGLLNLVSSILV